MKHILIDLETKQSYIFSCKTEISNRLKVSAQTLRNWQKSGNTKQKGKYFICFDAMEVKSKQKAHNRSF
jgi:hypothetical protein